MRLKAHINETIAVGNSNYTEKDIAEFNKFWSEVEKNCKPFLAEIRSKNNDMSLVRGVQNSNDDFIFKNVRQDRKPKDSSREWHNAFGKAFKKRFGWNPRTEGMFVFGENTTEAGHYGNVYWVFPTGDYKYVWSTNIDDLYSQIENYQISPPDNFREDAKENYEEFYGEGKSGTWAWNGKELDGEGISRKEAAAQFIEMHNEDLPDEEDHITGDAAIRATMKEVEWYPHATFREFYDNEIGEWEPEQEDYDKTAEQIISDGNYHDSGMIEAIHHKKKPEISIKTKGYFGAEKDKWYDLIKYYLFEKKKIE